MGPRILPRSIHYANLNVLYLSTMSSCWLKLISPLCYNLYLIAGILLGNYSDEWKKQRNVSLDLMRSLGWGKSSLEDRMHAEGQFMLEYIHKTEGKTTDPTDIIGVAVSNIICSMLFGRRYDYDDNDFKRLLKNVTCIMKEVESGRNSTLKQPLSTVEDIKTTQETFINATRELNDFYRKKLAEAMETINSDPDPRAFLRLYMNELPAYNQQNNARLVEDWSLSLTSDFFLAGSETTASTLRWAVLVMANYPDIQAKIHQEMDDLVGKEKYEFSLSDRERLPYTMATLSEIQRYAPILPMSLQHETMQDVTVSGYMIPKNTIVSVIMILDAHSYYLNYT